MSGRFVAPKLDDAILVEFALKPGAAPDAIAALRQLGQKLSVPPAGEEACHAAEEDRITAYLRGIRFQVSISAMRDIAMSVLSPVAAGDIEVSRLAALRFFWGASPTETPLYHYVVRTDVEPGGENELERWYDEEHLPALAAVPGVVLAQRLVSLDAGPRYYACYDLTSPDVLKSAPWQAARGTDWSGRVRSTFRQTRRVISQWLPEFAVSEQ
jgi:hypothetical protein